MGASLIIGAAIVVVAFIAVSAVLRGWALSILWGWFIVPFFGLPPLTIPYAIGIALVVGYLTSPGSSKNEDVNWLGMILTPFVALLVGWVVTWFI